MASEKPTAASDGAEEADLAKAFQELAKGERAATAVENQLSVMEEKIEALLAQAEREQQDVWNMRGESTDTGGTPGKLPSDEQNEKDGSG